MEPMGIVEQGCTIFGIRCGNVVLGKEQNTMTDMAVEGLAFAKNGTKISPHSAHGLYRTATLTRYLLTA